MLSKYLKDNALEDMKVDLSALKSELQKKKIRIMKSIEVNIL